MTFLPTILSLVGTFIVLAAALYNRRMQPTTLIALVVAALLPFVVDWIGSAHKTTDYEILNGEITNKHEQRVSCEHSYQCNCVSYTSCSGSGTSRSCSTSQICQTCYDHSFDVDWQVVTTVGPFNIDRLDAQGLRQPPRWKSVVIGEPVAKIHSHTNYVKAVPASLFNFEEVSVSQEMLAKVPEYPIGVYDYHRLNRALSVGVAVPDLQRWSDDISTLLKRTGPSKEVNLIILFVNTSDASYEYALRKAWLGGKKNDVIVIIGTTSYPTIDFVRVVSWTDSEVFKVTLRDDLQDLKTLDRQAVMDAISKNILKTFARKRMRDFEYLKTEIETPTWAWIMAVVLQIAVGFAIVYFNRPAGQFSLNRPKRRFSR